MVFLSFQHCSMRRYYHNHSVDSALGYLLLIPPRRSDDSVVAAIDSDAIVILRVNVMTFFVTHQNGKSGLQGAQGAAGTNGAQGPAGPAGPAGPPGNSGGGTIDTSQFITRNDEMINQFIQDIHNLQSQLGLEQTFY